MAGIFAFMSKNEGKRLLAAENPYMYQQAISTDTIKVNGQVIEKIAFKPVKHQENYMATTGAKLYFWDKVAMLSGYSSSGSDVMELVRKYGLKTFDTEAEVVNG